MNTILYCVSITIHADIEADWTDWMTRVHVPDVLKTGCFLQCRMFRVLDPSSEEPTYSLQYECRNMEDYRRYRDDYATALQALHSERYAGRFRGSRQVLELMTQVSADLRLREDGLTIGPSPTTRK